jgi:hypothetical protein
MRRATFIEVVHAAKLVGALTGEPTATYCFGGRLAVPLPGDWALAISADDAARLKFEACLGGRVVATMWAFAGDDRRLAELVSAALEETAALAA